MSFYCFCYPKNIFRFLGMCAHFLLHISSGLDWDSFDKIKKTTVHCWTRSILPLSKDCHDRTLIFTFFWSSYLRLWVGLLLVFLCFFLVRARRAKKACGHAHLHCVWSSSKTVGDNYWFILICDGWTNGRTDRQTNRGKLEWLSKFCRFGGDKNTL